MHLQSWDKTYSGKTHGGDHVFDPAVHLSAVLGCPCCKRNQLVEAPGHRIGQRGPDTISPADRLARCIGWEIKDLSKQRPCDHCGVISVMPSADLKRLTELVQAQVTLGWVAQQEARTIEEQKKVA
jgi:hypothetical protein